MIKPESSSHQKIFLLPSLDRSTYWTSLKSHKYAESLSHRYEFTSKILEADIIVIKEKNSPLLTERLINELKSTKDNLRFVVVDVSSPFDPLDYVAFPVEKYAHAFVQLGFLSTPEQILEALDLLEQKAKEIRHE